MVMMISAPLAASAALAAWAGENHGAISRDLVASLSTYDTAHKAVRALDDGGNWDAAVSLATSNDPKGTKAAFTAFDTSSRAALTSQSSQAAHGLNSASGPLSGVAVLMLLAGIAAAVLAWRGISVRLREYR